MISSVGGIRTLFLLLEQAVSRRVDLSMSSVHVPSEFDLQFNSSSQYLFICCHCAVLYLLSNNTNRSSFCKENNFFVGRTNFIAVSLTFVMSVSKTLCMQWMWLLVIADHSYLHWLPSPLGSHWSLKVLEKS